MLNYIMSAIRRASEMTPRTVEVEMKMETDKDDR